MQIQTAITYFIGTLQSEQLSAHSIRAYEKDLIQFQIAIEKDTLDEINFEDFQKYFLVLSKLKVTSMKRKRVVVQRFLKYCYRNRMTSEKLYEFIEPIKSKKNSMPKEVLSKEEITKLLAYLSKQCALLKERTDTPYHNYLYYSALRNELLIHVLLYTGCRAHEAVSIKKQDINFQQNTIMLFTKGAKYNQVPIHDLLLEAFERYYKGLDYVEEPLRSQIQKSLYIFPSKNNIDTYMATRTLRDFMDKLSEVMGRHIHAHLFRHTFASYCIAANMDISTISSLISHSNPSITLSIYTHEIDAHNKQAQIKKLSFQ